MPGRATILEVARALSVAPSTVSRAFNYPHLLKRDTVDKVVETAERLGYVPNVHARALVKAKTGLIGLIVPDITNPFFPPLVRAAQHAAEAAGQSVVLAETNADADRERAHIASLAPHCAGLIIASSQLTPEELRRVAESTRLVLLNNDTSGVARVLISSSDALAEGLRVLAAQGARRLCYVGGPQRSWCESERRGTVEHWAAKLGMSVRYLRVESGTYREARQSVSEGAFDVDAVIAFDDVIACGVLDVLSEGGVRIPDEVALLGCGDALPVQTRPRLSTIRLRGAEGVTEAVRLIASALGKTIVEQRIVLPGVLQLRETT